MTPAEAAPSEVSTKRCKLEEKEREEKLQRGEAADAATWPEPQKYVAPPVRTAVVIPEHVTCPDGCKRLGSSPHADSLSAKCDPLLFQADNTKWTT